MSLRLGTTLVAGTPNINGKADISLSNLNSTGKNIGNWSANVTNCITEIPQNIKLTLSEGTLTLSSSSQCYLKDGTVVYISNNSTTTQTTNGKYFVIYNGSGIITALTTAYTYSTLPSTYSYPLAVITVSNGAISSIDQVFNGFGYIGNIVFALPGVKGLIPNGRNADGTLKNTSFTIPSVITSELSASYTEVYIRAFDFGWSYAYDEERNLVHLASNKNELRSYAYLGTYKKESDGTITSFKPKTALHLVDYNDLASLSVNVDTDDKSITRNASDELQTIGVINQNDTTTAIKTWSGTKAQYDLLTPDANTLYTITDDETYTTSANTDLSNLSTTGTNITNWSANVTNCITSIAQDIKLEVSDSALTLKAGSKIYIPNGFEQDGTTPKFDAVISSGNSSIDVDELPDGTYLLICEDDGLGDELSITLNVGNYPASSGSTQPTGNVGDIWYDTTNNFCKGYNDSWFNLSFPIAIITVSSGMPSINQVFNGFGYVGSTLFTLPGINYLCPNGFNRDGSYRNNLGQITTVSICEETTDGIYDIILSSNTIEATEYGNYSYAKEKNKNILNDTEANVCHAGIMLVSDGKITTIDNKNIFRILDYNDLYRNRGNDIFDFKWSDHIITDINWLRADTFGWHYGTAYKNIYDHLTADITGLTPKTRYFEVAWTQPIATGATTTTDLGDITISATSQYSGRQGYKCMDGVTSGTDSGKCWCVNNTSAVHSLTITFPYKLRITGIRGYKPHLGTATNGDTIGQFYTDNTKTTPIGDQYVNANGAPSWTIVDVSGLPEEGVITNTLFFEKTGGGNYGGFGELEITATRLLSDLSFSVYETPDGHKIVPYQEGVLDALNWGYEQLGASWYYVLDTSNQRFILPRTKWGFIGYRDKVGELVNLGATGIDYSASQMYLYFYAGAYTRDVIEQTAGLNASLFDGKVDTSGQNFTNEGKGIVAGFSMPGTTYDELTLAASGSTYTAPANGYFVLSKAAGASGKYIRLTGNAEVASTSYATANVLTICLPVSQYEVVTASYDATGTTNYFRFVYAKGAE